MIPLFAVQVIRENEAKLKHQLIMNSVTRSTYWFSNFVGDYVLCGSSERDWRPRLTASLVSDISSPLSPLSSVSTPQTSSHSMRIHSLPARR